MILMNNKEAKIANQFTKNAAGKIVISTTREVEASTAEILQHEVQLLKFKERYEQELIKITDELAAIADLKKQGLI